MPSNERPTISRRQMVAASVGGALLGSSWGMAFRDASSHDESPALTVAWNRDGVAALIEYRRCRALLLDCPDSATQAHLTELVTGFMRQRIDVLFAPDSTLQTLPTGARSRWKIAQVLALDPNTVYPQIGAIDRSIEIDGLVITGRGIQQEQRSGAETPRDGWYVDFTYGNNRIVIAPSERTLSNVVPSPDLASLLIVVDEQAVLMPRQFSGSALAAPSGSDIPDYWAV